MPFKKGISRKPKASESATTQFIREHISQAIVYLFV